MRRVAWTRLSQLRVLAGLARDPPGRRKWRSVDGFNAHLLADIGVRHEATPLRGFRPPDSWLLAQHLR